MAWIESLSKETVTLDALKKLYAPNVHYHDPFHDVDGIESIHKIYDKMFDQMDEIKIKVTGHAVNGSMAFISWKTLVTAGKKQGEFEGTTRLLFDENGLVKDSFDYCDASILFEGVPILGCIIKWIRRSAK